MNTAPAQLDRTFRRSDEHRYLVIVLVAALHAALLVVLIDQSGTVRLRAASAPALTAFILRPTRRAYRSPFKRPALSRRPVRVAPITVSPLAVPAALHLPIAPSRPIDWLGAAKRAVQSILARKAARTFGFPKGAAHSSSLHSSPDDSAARVGDSYRTRTGQHTEWVSQHCYVTSDPTPLDEPDFLKQAQMSRTECNGSAEPSPGELFKSLPAYKRLHPHQ